MVRILHYSCLEMQWEAKKLFCIDMPFVTSMFVFRNYMDNVSNYSCEMNFYPCTTRAIYIYKNKMDRILH